MWALNIFFPAHVESDVLRDIIMRLGGQYAALAMSTENLLRTYIRSGDAPDHKQYYYILWSKQQ